MLTGVNGPFVVCSSVANRNYICYVLCIILVFENVSLSAVWGLRTYVERCATTNEQNKCTKRELSRPSWCGDMAMLAKTRSGGGPNLELLQCRVISVKNKVIFYDLTYVMICCFDNSPLIGFLTGFWRYPSLPPFPPQKQLLGAHRRAERNKLVFNSPL